LAFNSPNGLTDPPSEPKEPKSPRAVYRKLKSNKKAEIQKDAGQEDENVKSYAYDSAAHDSSSRHRAKSAEHPENLLKKIQGENSVKSSKLLIEIDHKGRSPSDH
jgi:hypothetical protein